MLDNKCATKKSSWLKRKNTSLFKNSSIKSYSISSKCPEDLIGKTLPRSNLKKNRPKPTSTGEEPSPSSNKKIPKSKSRRMKRTSKSGDSCGESLIGRKWLSKLLTEETRCFSGARTLKNTSKKSRKIKSPFFWSTRATLSAHKKSKCGTST